MFFEHPRCLRLRPHSSGKSCPAIFSALGAGKKFSLEMETSSSLFLGAFENRLKVKLAISCCKNDDIAVTNHCLGMVVDVKNKIV